MSREFSWLVIIAALGFRQTSTGIVEEELLSAVAAGNFRLVEKLLEQNVDIAAENKEGRTPIQIAAFAGNKDLVDLLLEKQADPSAHDRYGFAPLHGVAFTQEAEVANSLIKYNAKLDAQDTYGRTPLYLAVSRGNTEFAEILLKQNADINAESFDGWCPLHAAIFYENEELAKWLIAQKADINTPDKKEGITPLQMATKCKSPEVAEMLIESNADVMAKDKEGWTTLHHAAWAGQRDICWLLIERKVDVGTKDSAGWTALHAAAEEGYKDVCELLFEHNANINAVDNDGITPLHAACAEGKAEIVEWLLQQNADPLAQTKKRGRTPLYFAEENQDQQIIKIIKYWQVVNPKKQHNLIKQRIDALWFLNKHYFGNPSADFSADQKLKHQQMAVAIERLALSYCGCAQEKVGEESERHYYAILKLLLTYFYEPENLAIENKINNIIKTFINQHTAEFLTTVRYPSSEPTRLFCFTTQDPHDNPMLDEKYFYALSKDNKEVWWSDEAELYCLRLLIDKGLVDALVEDEELNTEQKIKRWLAETVDEVR